jgi:hypothetical protein
MAIGTAAAIIGSAAIGAAGSAFAANRAAKAQSRSARQGINAQREMFERQTELQAPFREGGLTAQNRLMTLLGLAPTAADGETLPPGLAVDTTSPDFGRYARDFGMQDFTADPGYGFRMSEGMKALERSAAARGGLLSGATLKGIQRFGQDLASTEYQNAFNRYQVNRAAQLNPLQSLMGSGQTSANVLTAAAGGLGQGLAQGYGNMGQARASGYVGTANALTSGLQGGMQNYMLYNYLNPASGAAATTASPYAFGAGGYTGYGPFMG